MLNFHVNSKPTTQCKSNFKRKMLESNRIFHSNIVRNLELAIFNGYLLSSEAVILVLFPKHVLSLTNLKYQ